MTPVLSGVWSRLIGQEKTVRELQRAAEQNTIHHAWLITGPPGSGRSTAASAFATAINCERQNLSPRGCAECSSCTLAASKTHPDISRIATDKSVITIDEAREIVRLSYDRPARGRYRIIIIEDADRMSERTTNVLLKAIEEPAPHTLWILCTPSPGDVLVTIRSRCRLIGLRLPDPSDVARLLVEQDGFSPEIADSVARAAQSHVGIARRLAQDPEARARRQNIVRLPEKLSTVSSAMRAASSLVELADSEAHSSFAEFNAQEKSELLRQLGVEEGASVPPAMRAQVKRLEEDQSRRAKRAKNDYYDRALTDLLSWYRDVLMLQTGAGSELVNVELEQSLRPIAAARTPESTLQHMDIINTTRRRLVATNVAPALAIEAMMLQLLPRAFAPSPNS